MPQAVKYLSVFIPEELLAQIEDFRYRERVSTRAQAIRMLVGGVLTNDAAKNNENEIDGRRHEAIASIMLL